MDGGEGFRMEKGRREEREREREREKSIEPNQFQISKNLSRIMKREGKQHGSAKYHPNKTARYIEKVPSMGFEIPVGVPRSAPSNGSKFSGKCKKARCKSCHYHPVTKSKDKTKGAYKLKSCDVALNHRLVSWRIVGDDLGALKYKGVSASAVLKDLAGSIYSSNYSSEEVDNNVEYSYDYGYGSNNDIGNINNDNNNDNNNLVEASEDFIGFGGLFDEIEFGHDNFAESSDDFVGFGALFDEIGEMEQLELDGVNGETNEIENNGSESESESEKEDDMGFYMVGVVKEFSDNEDWLVVEEI